MVSEVTVCKNSEQTLPQKLLVRFLTVTSNHKVGRYRISQKQPPKVFLKISQNSRENTCARASLLIKLLALGLKRDSGIDVFL